MWILRYCYTNFIRVTGFESKYRNLLRNSGHPEGILKLNAVSFSWVLLLVITSVHAQQYQLQNRDSLRKEPLPIEAVLTETHYLRYDLSPDGQLIAYEILNSDTNSTEIRVERLTDHSVLFSSGASANPVWAPDSRRLAYYSERDGVVELWIWSRDSRVSGPVRGVVIPGMSAHSVRWLSDSQRLLALTLPKEEQDVEAKDNYYESKLPHEVSKGVNVRVAEVTVEDLSDSIVSAIGRAKTTDGENSESIAGLTEKACIRYRTYGQCDLVVVNVDTEQVIRLINSINVHWFSPSPDDRYLAYTSKTGSIANTQQNLFALSVARIHGLKYEPLLRITNIRLIFGDTISWSPDSRWLAYTEQGQVSAGVMGLVNVAERSHKALRSSDLPSFNTGNSDFSLITTRAPIWSRDSLSVYALSHEGTLWRVHARTGQGSQVAGVRRIVDVLMLDDSARVDDRTYPGRALVAAQGEGGVDDIIEISLVSGKHHLLFRAFGSLLKGATDASLDNSTISFMASTLKNAPLVWLFNTADGSIRRASMFKEPYEEYQLGEVRLMQWQTSDGRRLRGALLLPPDYCGQYPLPLVVWVYGGVNGSESVGRFGLKEAPIFNMHILATRGYAVLYPDAPTRVGQPAADIFSAVMSGVDSAIEQGYADQNRLAIMGHSYGSYSVLAVIVRTTRFAAAEITGVMHPDLLSNYLLSPAFPPTGGYIGFFESGNGQLGGSPWEFPRRYIDNSPALTLDRIVTPLLMGHGELDTTTPVSGPNSLFVALKRLGKPVEYRLYAGEKHVLQRKSNVIDFWKHRLAFLERNLKLRVDESGRIIPDRDAVKLKECRSTQVRS